MAGRIEIKTFEFSEEGRKKLKAEEKGSNWPVVYFLCNQDTLYIGEASSAERRLGEHLKNPQKIAADFKEIKVIFDDTFNKSVVLDYEQRLIKYCKTDGKYLHIINGNDGQSDEHDYYQRDYFYANHFTEIWGELLAEKLVHKTIQDVENENLFKYSPYNILTTEQQKISDQVLDDIYDKLTKKQTGISLINGGAGTGKTIVAINMIYSILHQKKDYMKDYADRFHKPKIGFLFPMSGIRAVIEDVFKSCGGGLDVSMIINPYTLKTEEYDIIFVDESHRLSRRKNIMNYGKFDKTCSVLGLDKNDPNVNQLDWVLMRAKYKVLFYDKDQNVKSADITPKQYQNSLKACGDPIKEYELKTQMRCEGGAAYINYIKRIFACEPDIGFEKISNYDFKIYDNADAMIEEIRCIDDEMGLCRTVAGASWIWNTKPNKHKLPDNLDYYKKMVAEDKYDIGDIGDVKYIWNTQTAGWVTRQDAKYTIGCIHTTQGFDMNYVGVIFGKEIDYDPSINEITIDKDKFFDKNVKSGVDDDTLKKYIINTYVTMMARGIKGCYVYVYNDHLREYLKKFIKNAGLHEVIR